MANAFKIEIDCGLLNASEWITWFYNDANSKRDLYLWSWREEEGYNCSSVKKTFWNSILLVNCKDESQFKTFMEYYREQTRIQGNSFHDYTRTKVNGKERTYETLVSKYKFR